jgi:hypothetical protein
VVAEYGSQSGTPLPTADGYRSLIYTNHARIERAFVWEDQENGHCERAKMAVDTMEKIQCVRGWNNSGLISKVSIIATEQGYY